MLTVFKFTNQKLTDSLYVKRKEGGRGLLQVEAAYKAEIINIAEYRNTKDKEDQFVNTVKVHESTQQNMNSILKSAAKFLEDLNQLSGMNDAKQDGMQHTKAKWRDILKKKWKNKINNGKYIRNMDRQLISEEDMFLCNKKRLAIQHMNRPLFPTTLSIPSYEIGK